VKANPLLHITPKIEDLRAAATRASLMPSEEADFRRARCNQWVDYEIGEGFRMEHWAKCEKPLPLEEHHGDPCFPAFDLGSTRDMSALVLNFERDGGFDFYPFYWVPADAVSQRAEYDRKNHELWIAEGSN
jgi:phage terminase large subunit-like protein